MCLSGLAGIGAGPIKKAGLERPAFIVWIAVAI